MTLMMSSLHHCSDIVVQIVDARNPLLFRCEDLVSRRRCYCGIEFIYIIVIQETYVKEVSSRKENMLLLSKADLLTPFQRCCLVLRYLV